MKIAIIAEKPSVAREIAAIVGATIKHEGYMQGNNYLVTWAFGHLIQLAMPEEYGAIGEATYYPRNIYPKTSPDKSRARIQRRSGSIEAIEDYPIGF